LVHPSAHANSLTALVRRTQQGDRAAANELFLLVHGELHAVARRLMQGQPPGHTLQASALVNEAYLRVFQQEWKDRDHFLAVAAQAMRWVLVDHARTKRCAKRERGAERVPLEGLMELYEERSLDLVALDEALDRLAQRDPGLVRLVELRFFGGLSMEDAARTLSIPLRTAQREWATARAWLRKELA
jgi:RNA polymerase sigma factor (TIGR02999 family)